MQLPFAVIPLVQFASDPAKVGRHAISRPLTILSWAVAALIVSLNLKLLWDTAIG
jgi:manganese transport protein